MKKLLLGHLLGFFFQVPCLSDDLYERVYDFFKKLLTLPKPFCTIGLDYACQLKLERAIPGRQALFILVCCICYDIMAIY